MAFRRHPASTRRWAASLAVLAASTSLSSAADPAATTTPPPRIGPQDPAKIEFFEKKIRPLLANNCFTCHSASTNSKGGLRVDDRAGLVQGGNGGSAVVPGDADNSLLIQAVRYSGDAPKMPPEGKLSDEQIADLEKWVQEGAAWPAAKPTDDVLHPEKPQYQELKKNHWAWQPLSKPRAPSVLNAAWPRDDVDRFILARLEQEGLGPTGDADKTTLLRRVTFDLVGLPPTPEEVDAFLQDASPDAFAKVVDRLLASPTFGERWGRHWLDVARYGESTGSARNLPTPHAWRYRDYVIDAVNKDKPYDEFLREQIAGDLLPAATQEEKDEHRVATGFLALGVKDVNQRFRVRFIMDNVDEQIDTVSRTILGLTASCARCHDHKFDPISTHDYYAVAGIFQSSDLCAGLRSRMGGGGLDYYETKLLIPLGTPEPEVTITPELAEKQATLQKQIAEARSEFQKLQQDASEGLKKGPDGRPKRAVARQKLNKLQAELATLTDPSVNGKAAYGVRDAKLVGDTEIRIRGEAEALGPVVPRGFLSVVQFEGQLPVNPKESGRLELALWLSSERNPLTSRVIVNRIWKHLFGQGIVTTVDNFGVTGDKPSHPELLDHLANRFIQNGWSLKKQVKALVLTRAYQLAGDPRPAHLKVDPANRLVWRHSPRRLDAEEIRDATLAASGKLDPSRPNGSPAKELKPIEIRNNGLEARGIQDAAAASLHRSVYLPLVRTVVPRPLEVFDFADQGMTTGDRDTTTVAPQALYLLNDPFVRKQSIALAERVLSLAALDEGERIGWAYRLTVGRKATPAEVERAKVYLKEFEEAAREVESTQVASAAPAAEPAADDPTAEAPAGSSSNGAKKPAAPPEPIDPDAVDQSDLPVKEEVVKASDSKTAAWASFCQALLGAAEFRYVQ